LPLLAISIFNFHISLKSNEKLLLDELKKEAAVAASDFERLLQQRELELKNLAASGAIMSYVIEATRPPSAQAGLYAFPIEQASDKVSQVVRPLALDHNHYATIAVFSPSRRLMFVADFEARQSTGQILFRTEGLLPNQIQPDNAVWTTGERKPICSAIDQAAVGKVLRWALPILISAEDPLVRGALVADVKLDSLFGDVVKAQRTAPSSSHIVVVLDDDGSIIYHSNDALKHQDAKNSMPYFSSVAAAMVAGQSGSNFYTSSDGDKWLAVYTPLFGGKLSLALARNYSVTSSATRRYGWLGVILALVMGTGATLFLTSYYLKRTQSIDRVVAGVGEIAKGRLDHRIELLSSDDLRPLADNVDLVTRQLRDQLAREAESRQFDSFVRLSAVLTHDLKNAIEALSLTVANMERHFENADFRADAMKTLRGATENLRSLVSRLSQPVATLSGEHKRPRPADLVPVFHRVISMTAKQTASHKIEIDLPESLHALVDIERMDKVAENLIINALESMGEKGGTLTVRAGKTEDGKPFFSVSDTGCGMSKRFIEERLFHPFATTKKRGVGLGLYTCREVVRANGGVIEVDSEEGVGTTFRVILLPATPNSQADMASRS
jgi:signal transduction histidine kinase